MRNIILILTILYASKWVDTVVYLCPTCPALESVESDYSYEAPVIETPVSFSECEDCED